jgi:hypothetical protein
MMFLNTIRGSWGTGAVAAVSMASVMMAVGKGVLDWEGTMRAAVFMTYTPPSS